MTRCSKTVSSVLAAAVAAFALGASPAQALDSAQQGCVNALNKTGAKVAATQGKAISSCIKAAAKDKLVEPTVDACFTADTKGKIAGAEQKTTDAQASKCSAPFPTFAYETPATINGAATDGEIAMAGDIFGSPVDTAMQTGDTGSCQAAVNKAYEKLAATRMKSFLSCKKSGLKDLSIDSAAQLEPCITDDPKGKVTKAADKLGATVTKKCAGVTLASAFPGCSSEAGSDSALANCVARKAECNVCLSLNDMDGLENECDEVDDGVVNGTCRQCGNGFVESPEECDDGNLTSLDGCDENCLIECGNGVLDPGELCDDGNRVSYDGCSATCQDGPGSGESHEQCPNRGELVLYSKLSNIPCTDNNDCTAPRTCDTSISRCTTATELDTGWNGAGHDSDINDQVRAAARLACDGPPSPDCGQCDVLGLDPTPGNCRCANNVATKCDEPFQNDADDCGGAACNCFFGAPFPLSAQGTPVCVSNKFSEDITGTANPDLGSGQISANLRSQVFLGHTRDLPCPVCGGKCSNDNSGCIFDSDCDGGATCVQDTPGDGIRDGQCIYDENNHTAQNPPTPCDIDGQNASFPAIIGNTVPGSGGAGYSIDCQPEVGKNVSGAGLIIKLQQSTGTSTLGFGVDCDGAGAGTALCPCLVCSGDQTFPCNSNAECAPLGGNCALATHGGGVPCNQNTDCAAVDIGPCNNLGKCTKRTTQGCGTNADCQNFNAGNCDLQTCTSRGSGVTPEPNYCSDDICTDMGGGEGECASGPSFMFCDALVKADGAGASACTQNADCAGGYGNCTITDPADCFLDPIVATGSPDPDFPVAAATFCVPPTSNSGINSSAGLPGPGRVVNQGEATTYCTSNPAVQYTPGGIPACP